MKIDIMLPQCFLQVLAKLELKKHLAKTKGAELKPVKIKRGKADRAAVYQFPLERKR